METQRIDMAAGERGAGKDGRVAGLVLIGLGAAFLAARLFDLGVGLLPILAAGFVAAGIATRQAGWFIPGGVLAGIGLGAWISEAGVAGDPAEGGLFLLCFAAGWGMVYLLSRLFTATPLRWALIPGGVMAVIGGAILIGESGERFLELTFGTLSVLWPLALVGFGLALLLRRRGEG